ncbi:GH92 family glycosyl hydrolase [Rheinheimera sp. SA_1]|uniref:GH92 family glycosyl hydrolase n=1 Tax=Rheinheimera sp. SA_1 TaxID=1827365 RepID=UPI000A4FA80A|nr:GH92 family glycosyl hydrolase [Rheinheimera sp. SA_1]
MHNCHNDSAKVVSAKAIAVLASLLLMVGVTSCSQPAQQAPQQATANNSADEVLTATDPLLFVDPLIGTDGKGKTYPGATVPYGMVQLSPDNGRTGWDWIAGYFYPDTIIAGFSHTHLSGTGAGDLYDISFMPLRLPLKREKTDGGPAAGTLVSSFSHQQEQAQAGYYQVYLPDYRVNVELTAGLRTGYQRYRFDEIQAANSAPLIRLDLGYSRNWDKTTASAIRIIDAYSIEGYRYSSGWAPKQKVYFYTKFSKPISSLQWQLACDTEQLQADGSLSTVELSAAAKQQQGVAVALLLQFATAHRDITVRTALSSVSSDNARQNLLAEGEALSFDEVKQQAQQAWRTELSQVQVTASRDNLIQFYTALYHSALAPRVFADSDGRFLGPDGQVHQRTDHTHHDFFSLWDTFRALHPWKTLFNPERNQQQLLSLLDHAEISGLLPVWNFQGNETDMMLGYHAVPVLVDNYLKGHLTSKQPQELGDKILQLAVKSAKQQAFGLQSYQQLGYVPYAERKWNVALTLEYAYDDWAIARLAEHLGKTDIAAEFRARSQNYHQHFDTTTGFMRAKDGAGKFRMPFDPNAYHPEDYCEANAWQYSFFVPHDVPGLIALYGGPAAFTAKLDQMFSTAQLISSQTSASQTSSAQPLPEWISGYIGQYVHGNEPSHHVPYLYQYAGKPAKTQALVRRIMHELYSTKPDGLAGNEDAGQMSAWYLFSALGFYPVDPVSGEYVLGSPEVHQAILQLGNGKQLTVKALNQSPQHLYVKAVTFNGTPVTGFTISHQQLMQGGELIFTMSEQAP